MRLSVAGNRKVHHMFIQVKSMQQTAAASEHEASTSPPCTLQGTSWCHCKGNCPESPSWSDVEPAAGRRIVTCTVSPSLWCAAHCGERQVFQITSGHTSGSLHVQVHTCCYCLRACNVDQHYRMLTAQPFLARSISADEEALLGLLRSTALLLYKSVPQLAC